MTSELALRAWGSCRVCSSGDLVFAVMAATHDLIIECRECLTGYTQPHGLATSGLVRMEATDSRLATVGEVQSAGLHGLLAD